MGDGEAFRPEIPNTARMYDYYLGGKCNFPRDREAAERAMAALPAGVVRSTTVQDRRFLRRVVRYLTADLGVRQFLDIGAGLPAMNDVHEVAQSIAPDSRVVYVDNDPVVVTHGHALLNGDDRATIILGDLRDPAGILADPALRAILDFDQPIAVLLIDVLHFIADEQDPHGIIGALMDAVPAGSHLVISHFTTDSYAQARDIAAVYEKSASSVHSRTRAEVAALVSGHELIDPGAVVWASQWHPDRATGLDGDPGQSLSWCAVARKTRPGPPGALPAPAPQPPPAQLSGWVRFRPAASWPAPARPAARFSPDVPNVARMYDYMLGGKDNYPADRAAAEQAFAALSEDVIRGSTLQNRKFLSRAVRYLVKDLGIRQFLDIGAGLPAMNNVHEVAHAAAPGTQVVYVDNDPVVIAHGRDMLNGVANATIIPGDLRDPAAILADPLVRSRLDFSQPVAVLLVAVLHFIADEEGPRGIVAALMDAVPAGGHLAVSHVSADHYTRATSAARVYDDASAGLHMRSRAELAAILGGFSLVDPGELVWTAQWHPDEQTPPVDTPGGATMWCGIALK
jgi:hypothetical protein